MRCNNRFELIGRLRIRREETALPIPDSLKLLANATSYGVLIEVIVDERKKETGTTVYHGGAATRKRARTRIIGDDGAPQTTGYKVERPGKWFAPYGVLIPAAGRLMIAMIERIATDRGLFFAFCDTDGVSLGRPHGMARETFRKAVFDIAAALQSLNPYRPDLKIQLFNIEDINYRLRDNECGKVTCELEPLYALVISAKRYALFNRGEDGSIIIRKASAHGLGDVGMPAHYNHLTSEHTRADHIAAPVVKDDHTKEIKRHSITGEPLRRYGRLAQGKGARFFCDLWRIAITQFDRGTPEKIGEIVDTLEVLIATENRPGRAGNFC
jgi:hypothetical protein